MVEYYIKYQASIFGSFADIAPTSKDMAKLLSAFADKAFITSVVQELAGPMLQNRIRLTNPPGDYSILIGTNRIAIERGLAKPHGENMGTLVEFALEACDIFRKIIELYPRQANRLSLTAQCFCKQMDEARMNEIWLRLTKPSPFFAAKCPFEWNVRQVSTEEIQINKTKEMLNVIMNVSRLSAHIEGPGLFEDTERISFETDINTKPVNQQPRFGSEHFEEYFKQAYILHGNLIDETTKYLT